ncbi:helix-turn-helix domain-containing protein [Vibrio sp. Of7-15]|uniref:helix-turn-helix domain-containing protein n=1 Tax=Vibrio sp. Of7-15 TaxID=2724879 RepID=UPI001EF1CCB7|nr:helix-turn-helix domain-containing protein [Vibrio sp. Of7-15]MCG7498328.1 helix-turn-helix domain-containing protein [Vibrio sp. Of7-15]
MKRIAILTYDNAALFELGCAVELFALPRPEIEDWYQTQVVTFDDCALEVTGGVKIMAQQVSSLDNYDVVVIPSWSTHKAEVSAKLRKAMLDFHKAKKRILSFCSGAFLLAELGLLDGRKATTHWRYAALFSERFPQITFVDNVLYLYDGQIGCSAGSAAALDLGIEVIRQDYGHKVANSIARRLVVSSHRKGGQSQFVETVVSERPNSFSEALDWALESLSQPIDVGQMAERANMSRRTFDRKFKLSLNMSPKEWLTQQRLALAKQMIEDTQYTIEQVATFAGFDNATTMRHHFRRVFDVSPRQYRDQFGNR